MQISFWLLHSGKRQLPGLSRQWKQTAYSSLNKLHRWLLFMNRISVVFQSWAPNMQLFWCIWVSVLHLFLLLLLFIKYQISVKKMHPFIGCTYLRYRLNSFRFCFLSYRNFQDWSFPRLTNHRKVFEFWKWQHLLLPVPHHCWRCQQLQQPVYKSLCHINSYSLITDQKTLNTACWLWNLWSVLGNKHADSSANKVQLQMTRDRASEL